MIPLVYRLRGPTAISWTRTHEERPYAVLGISGKGAAREGSSGDMNTTSCGIRAGVPRETARRLHLLAPNHSHNIGGLMPPASRPATVLEGVADLCSQILLAVPGQPGPGRLPGGSIRIASANNSTIRLRRAGVIPPLGVGWRAKPAPATGRARTSPPTSSTPLLPRVPPPGGVRSVLLRGHFPDRDLLGVAGVQDHGEELRPETRARVPRHPEDASGRLVERVPDLAGRDGSSFRVCSYSPSRTYPNTGPARHGGAGRPVRRVQSPPPAPSPWRPSRQASRPRPAGTGGSP